PPLLQWHRAYQSAIQRFQPALDLEARYRAYLEAEPEQPVWSYLLGRITDDPQAAETLYRKAFDDPKAGPYARGALAWRTLCACRFDDAYKLAAEAFAALPSGDSFERTRDSSLLALGRVDEVSKTLDARRQKDLCSPDLFETQLHLLAIQGKDAE